jgi:asparagine synthase (glutamine-hydrolysing)
MCGICGVLALDRGSTISPEELRAMTGTLVHRGPDDDGYYAAGPVALGFRRLSIVDLAGGHQPMRSPDGDVWIIFNGEIYNHAELRPALERRGHRYTTRSDTETILHLYEEYGDDCVHHLRGMFALAIWDARRQRLFCARDRLGIKPFYYVLSRGRFAFASEIKALFELPGLRAKMNRGALPEFFALGYISSEETLFEQVRKLLPGHRLSIDLSGPDPQPRIERYWDLDITPDDSISTEAAYVARFHELFTESVRLRLMSDVPLGVFLSGGLDSSAIAAVMAGLTKEQVKTFSVGYAEDRFSELPNARQVAQHIGAEYNQVILGPDDFFASLPQLVWHEDEPLVWPSSVALHFVSRLAREKVKVVLTGEGGDELFAGYLKYRVTLWNLRYGPLYRKLVPGLLRDLARDVLASGALPDALRRKLRHSFLYYPDVFEKIYFDNFYSVFPQEMQSQLFSDELAGELREHGAYASSMAFFKPNGEADTLLSRLLYLDIKTYLVELLMKQDQMSMAASIESRVPFLDHKLVEFTARIPSRHKVRFLSAKYLLRRSMAQQLPPEVLHRRKMGFPTPIKPWLRHQLFDRVAAVLTDGRLAGRGLVNPGFVRNLLEAHRRGRTDATDAIWRLLNFELWNRVFFDRDPKPLSPGFAPQQEAELQASQKLV